MVRTAKRQRKRAEKSGVNGPEGGPMPKVPGIRLSMGALLSGAGLKPELEKPPMTMPPPAPVRPSLVTEAPAPPARERPRAELSAGDFAALNDAYRGVAPIRTPKRARTVPAQKPAALPRAVEPEDGDAREQLGSLVAGGQRFRVERDETWVRGLRADVPVRQLRALSSASFKPEATLDLHGFRKDEASRSIAEFIRVQHRRGVRSLLLIVGKGLHSDGGFGVLGETVVDELIGGVAAPLVAAFSSAHSQRGGSGAIAVQLASKAR